MTASEIVTFERTRRYRRRRPLVDWPRVICVLVLPVVTWTALIWGIRWALT